MERRQGWSEPGGLCHKGGDCTVNPPPFAWGELRRGWRRHWRLDVAPIGQSAPQRLGGDFLETGTVAGGNDLKLLTMSLTPAFEVGFVVLVRSNGNARVWKSPTKGQGNEILVNNDTKTWDLSNAQQRADFNALKNSLYVEGYGGGTAAIGLCYERTLGQILVEDWVYYQFIAADCGGQPRTVAVPTKQWNYITQTWFTSPEPPQKTHMMAAFPGPVGCESLPKGIQ